MVTFLIAFLLMCICHSRAWELVLVGAILVLIVAAVIWCIVMAWEPICQTVEAHVQVEFNIAERQGDRVEERDDEASRVRRPWKVSWRWPAFSFRRRTSDSDTTVAGVIPMYELQPPPQAHLRS